MISKKQKQRSKAYARKVKANHGGSKCFGGGEYRHAYGTAAYLGASRGKMNGRQIWS
jgi:hypothetical protein